MFKLPQKGELFLDWRDEEIKKIRENPDLSQEEKDAKIKKLFLLEKETRRLFRKLLLEDFGKTIKNATLEELHEILQKVFKLTEEWGAPEHIRADFMHYVFKKEIKKVMNNI